jgi:hypothetical protein
MLHQFWELLEKIVTQYHWLHNFLIPFHTEKQNVDRSLPPHVNLQPLATRARRQPSLGLTATRHRCSSSPHGRSSPLGLAVSHGRGSLPPAVKLAVVCLLLNMLGLTASAPCRLRPCQSATPAHPDPTALATAYRTRVEVR